MSKLQIVLIVVAIAASAVLFSLPRGVIKKKEEVAIKTENPVTNTKAPVAASSHQTKITSRDTEKITELRKAYFSVSGKEKKLKFADSLATYFKKLQQFDSSAKYLNAIAQLDPTKNHLVTAADALMDAGSLNEEQRENYAVQSRELYSEVLKKSPEDLEVKCKMAMTYVGGAATMQGVQLLREVLKEDPKNETAIYNLGILSLQSGQYKRAIDRFKDLIDINPANANAHFYLGMSFLNAGEKQKAKVAFKTAQALESDPAFQATVATYLEEVEK